MIGNNTAPNDGRMQVGSVIFHPDNNPPFIRIPLLPTKRITPVVKTPMHRILFSVTGSYPFPEYLIDGAKEPCKPHTQLDRVLMAQLTDSANAPKSDLQADRKFTIWFEVFSNNPKWEPDHTRWVLRGWPVSRVIWPDVSLDETKAED